MSFQGNEAHLFKRVVKNTFWNMGGKDLTFLLQFLLLPVIVHYLGTEGYGVWALASAIVGYLYPLDLGMRRALVYFLARNRVLRKEHQVRRFFESGLALVMMSSGTGMILLYGGLSYLLNAGLKISPDWYDVARTVILFRALAMAGELLTGVMKTPSTAAQDLDRVNLLQALITGITWSGMALLAYLTRDLRWMSLWFAGVHGLSVVAFYLLSRPYFSSGHPVPRLFRRETRELIGFGRWLTLSHLLEPILIQSEKLFISRLVGLAPLGVYMIANQLVTRIWHIVTAFINAYFPALSEAVHKEPSTRHQEMVLQGSRFIA